MGTFQNKLARLLRKVVDRLEHNDSPVPEPSPEAASTPSEAKTEAHINAPVLEAPSGEKSAAELYKEADVDKGASESEDSQEMPKWYKPSLATSKSFNRYARQSMHEIPALPPSGLLNSKEPAKETAESSGLSETPIKKMDWSRPTDKSEDEEGRTFISTSFAVQSSEGGKNRILPSGESAETAMDEPVTDAVFGEASLASQFRVSQDCSMFAERSTSDVCMATADSFRTVAENPNTAPTTLNWLAGQVSAEVRAAVAANPSTPQETLRRLSNDEEADVRIKVANNRKAGSDILRLLAADRNKVVAGEARSMLVKKLKTCEMDNTGANLLSTHKFKSTTNHVTTTHSSVDAIPAPPVNKKSGETTGESANAEQPLKDIEPGVASGEWHALGSDPAKVAYKQQKDTVKDLKFNPAAVYNRSGPPAPERNIVSPTASDTIAFLTMVAARATTPPSRLLELAGHESENVRKAVAENIGCPPEAFVLLVKDKAREVRLRLAENANCPLDVAKQLEHDTDPFVSYEARKHLRRAGSIGHETSNIDVT